MEGKITVNVWRKSGAIDFGSSKREIRVSEGSSYRDVDCSSWVKLLRMLSFLQKRVLFDDIFQEKWTCHDSLLYQSKHPTYKFSLKVIVVVLWSQSRPFLYAQ